MMPTRARPTGRRAPRRARRPRIEGLEGRALLSVTFGAYSDGMWAYNTAASPPWRHISGAIPTAMDEGASGTLFESQPGGTRQPGGTFRYDYFGNNGQGKWTQLTTTPASALSAARDNTFFGSFSSGTWEFNGSWHLLTPVVATKLAAASNNDVYASYSSGTWQYNGAWHLLTTAVPNAMDASPGGALFASFSSGTYEFNAGWTKLASTVANELAAVSNTMCYGTYSTGTWEWNNGWIKISPNVANHLGNDGATLIGSYGGSVAGTWIFDSGGWHKITSAQASLVG